MKESEQLKRFKEAARQTGADESDDALDRMMGKLDLKKKPGPAQGATRTDRQESSGTEN